MGSYSVEDRLIRIHPTLDRPDVPRYYVAWIVYHEMLHQSTAFPSWVAVAVIILRRFGGRAAV